MRLNRFLAAAGIGSRRHCDELIAAGRVTINGKACTDFSAQPGERDHVKVNGKLVPVAPPLTIMLHKPAGFVSTRKDPHGRDTVFDLLPAKFSRLFNVGRLDAQTEGLLLLTSDGDLAQTLTHPRYKIEKEYEVTLDRPWDPELASKLLRGIFLDGERARIARLRAVSPVRLRVVLRQGINRQIRRMFEAVGYRVKDLIRVRIANLRLGDSSHFAESYTDRNKEMTVVNVTTLTLLSRHLIPRMIAQHRGAILNVNSSAGFLPIPGSAVYAATKAYVTSFSEALRAELRGTGVSVCALCPGPVVTEFQQVAKREGMKPDIGPQFIVVTVEQVVRDALAALEADRPLIIPGFAMKLLMLLARLMPMPVLRWVARMSPRSRGVV